MAFLDNPTLQKGTLVKGITALSFVAVLVVRFNFFLPFSASYLLFVSVKDGFIFRRIAIGRWGGHESTGAAAIVVGTVFFLASALLLYVSYFLLPITTVDLVIVVALALGLNLLFLPYDLYRNQQL